MGINTLAQGSGFGIARYPRQPDNGEVIVVLSVLEFAFYRQRHEALKTSERLVNTKNPPRLTVLQLVSKTGSVPIPATTASAAGTCSHSSVDSQGAIKRLQI